MSFFQKIRRGWMAFAHGLGTVNQWILLGVVYFVLVGMCAMLAWPFRLWGRRRKTTWKEAAPAQSAESLTRPF